MSFETFQKLDLHYIRRPETEEEKQAREEKEKRKQEAEKRRIELIQIVFEKIGEGKELTEEEQEMLNLI